MDMPLMWTCGQALQLLNDKLLFTRVSCRDRLGNLTLPVHRVHNRLHNASRYAHTHSPGGEETTQQFNISLFEKMSLSGGLVFYPVVVNFFVITVVNFSVDKNKYVAQYIKEMEGEIEKLTRERSEVDKLKTSSNLTDEQLQYIRDRLKDFAQRIKIELTDIQHSLLKQYVNSIVYDQFSGNYKMTYHIDIPNESSAGSLKVLEKTLYFTLD